MANHEIGKPSAVCQQFYLRLYRGYHIKPAEEMLIENIFLHFQKFYIWQ